jgi:hypothetical protein
LVGPQVADVHDTCAALRLSGAALPRSSISLLEILRQEQGIKTVKCAAEADEARERVRARPVAAEPQ